MPKLHESMATLRVMGDTLVPDEVSKLLDAVPSLSFAKGEAFGKDGKNIRRFGLWSLAAERCMPEDVNRQIAVILGKLTNNLEVWASLSKRYEIDLFCSWLMAGTDEGLSISPQNLMALGERGIELGICLYAPLDAADEEAD